MKISLLFKKSKSVKGIGVAFENKVAPCFLRSGNVFKVDGKRLHRVVTYT